MLHSKDIVFALLLVGSTVALDVQITPRQGEISVGESKFFLCEVVGEAEKIDWLSPSGDRIESNRPDVTVTRNDESSCTLTLYRAGVDNAGTYKCVATNGDQQAESTVNVKIYQKITFQNAPSPQEFNEGDSASLICDVISSPPPTVIWKHKGAKIQMEKDVRFKILSNNHLQIRGIKKTDEGMYTCEGRLMARGEIDFRVIKVVVNVAPSIRVWQSEVNATADAGQAAMLSCAADGFPEPMVSWARNGVVLEAGEKYSFNDDGSEMTLMDVAKLDEGEYTCIAKNKAGEVEQELSLRVFVKPRITYLVNQTASEMQEQVTLTCEASGDPTPTINWSSSKRVFKEEEQASWTRPEQHKSLDGNVMVRSDARLSSLTLKKAEYTDAGLYLCTARSSIGEDARHAYLEIRYSPKITGSVAVYTWEGNPANMSCEVLAHPSQVSLLWLRDGLQLPSLNTTNIKVYSGPSASFLEVTPESENDFGSYNCSASNEMGTESKEFLLIQADVPSAPSVGQVEPFSSSARVLFQEPEASGGVPILRYRAEWKPVTRGSWVHRVYEVQRGASTEVTITGLKPETNYEVKMSAANGKGEGDSSPAVIFKTEPVRYSYTREPNPPKLEGILQPKGNSLKVKWTKQDDGGSPITHYLVRFKPKQLSEWKPEMRMPSGSDYVVLTSLDWNTEYEVLVVAENLQGKSQPGVLTVRTDPEPAAIPADLGDESALSTGIIAGILLVAVLLLLLAVDVSCYFINKCGLIMCLCGKPGSTAKDSSLEGGKAAFMKDESKEPIVEVRTEDECTANHNAGGPTEPNETTPLTEPELAAHAAALALDTLSSVATNSDTPTADTFDPTLDSPSSETTTLTCSFLALASDPSPAPASAPAPTHAAPPKPAAPTLAPAHTRSSAPAPPTSPSPGPTRSAPALTPATATPPAPTRKISSDVPAKASPLLGDGAPLPEVRAAPAVTASDSPKPPRSPIPIPPKRRNSPKLLGTPRRASPPPSALATDSPSSSPTLNTNKPSPLAPANTSPGPEALVTPSSTKPTPAPPTALSTGLLTSTPPNTDPPAPGVQDTSAGPPPTKDILTPALTTLTPALTDLTATSGNTPTFLDADIISPGFLDSMTPAADASDILTPTPVAAPTLVPKVPIHAQAVPSATPTPISSSYDMLASTLTACPPATTEPRAPYNDLELSGVLSPSMALAELSRLGSAPVPAPSLANGDGADLLPLEDPETLAKAAVHNEKMICEEKTKEESDMKTALSEVTGELNNIARLNASESKA
ncbi:neural cell adhesion molecule 1b isoform X3 [Osmerus eperlanus]|uniref:neural cell adhesion molecule 1b isoform X3 n=1 Tax=Osmerus eperlanus TaxID=29151 RepID=UPI002E163C46